MCPYMGEMWEDSGLLQLADSSYKVSMLVTICNGDIENEKLDQHARVQAAVSSMVAVSTCSCEYWADVEASPSADGAGSSAVSSRSRGR